MCIRTAIFYPVLVATSGLLGTMAILTLFITRNSNIGHWYARLWGYIQVKVGGVKVIVRGIDKINTKQAYVYMANHQSWFDIFVLLAYIPGQFRWLAKEELYRIPIVGKAMKLIGYIPIDRSNRTKAFESLTKAAEQIRMGTSVMIFPEGTRSKDGVLQAFKKGGFILAIQSQQPILPISISGTHKVMPKGKWMITPGQVIITIHDPVSTEAIGLKDRQQLIEIVRSRILQGLSPEEQGIARAA